MTFSSTFHSAKGVLQLKEVLFERGNYLGRSAASINSHFRGKSDLAGQGG